MEHLEFKRSSNSSRLLEEHPKKAETAPFKTVPAPSPIKVISYLDTTMDA